MNRQNQHDRRAGLTLAEMMIALVISGLTLVITVQAATNIRGWAGRMGKAEETNSQITGLYQFTETMLSETQPLTRQDGERTIFLFQGSQHAVRFVRAEPGYPSRAGLYQYHLFAEQRIDEQWSFILERELLTDPSHFGTLQAPARLTLFTGTEAPLFTFSASGGWQQDWTPKEAQPDMVRFGMGSWPSLTIALPRAKKNTKTTTKDDTPERAKS